jgi:hypothetical protein
MRDHGVSLRLKAVQVVKLAEARTPANPFSSVDGFDTKEDNPFVGEGVSQEKIKETTADVFNEEEPKKKAKKKATPKPKKDEDISNLIDEWDD